MNHVDHSVLKTIRDTTRAAYGTPRGTIVEKKPGDWMLWFGSVVLLIAIPTTPQWLPFAKHCWDIFMSGMPY
jgi:hypothetical protein